MKRLLDTHLLLASALYSGLSASAEAAIAEAEPIFSVISVWEVAIKSRLGRSGFTVDPRVFRRELLDNGYSELPVTGEHAAAIAGLPTIHTDPFDRMLIAQAQVEGFELLTSDGLMAKYPGPIRKV